MVHNALCIASITFVPVNIFEFCKKLIAGKELGISMTYQHRLSHIPQWGIFEKIQIEMSKIWNCFLKIPHCDVGMSY